MYVWMSERMYWFSFRIRKRYFDAVRKHEKNVEYRRDIPFWRVRVANILHGIGFKFYVLWMEGEFLPEKVNAAGVFICGKRIHRRKIAAISRIKTPQDFSDQGKKDVDTPFCFAFHLGEDICK